MLSEKPVVGLKRYAAVADEEGLIITSQEATLAGVSSVVLSWNFEVMQLPRLMLTVFVWSAIIVTGLVDRKDLAHLRSGDSGLGSGSDSGCYFFGIIRLVYDRHKMVVAREERTGYGVGKIFINGGILRGAEGEGVVGTKDSQREAVHACLGR